MKDSIDTPSSEKLGFLDILSLILITLYLRGELSWWWGWTLLPWLSKYIFGFIALFIGLTWKKQ